MPMFFNVDIEMSSLAIILILKYTVYKYMDANTYDYMMLHDDLE